MFRYCLPFMVYVIAHTLLTGCVDKIALAKSSFDRRGNDSSKAAPASVISMGRDDDDGHARKWHIGGSPAPINDQ